MGPEKIHQLRDTRSYEMTEGGSVVRLDNLPAWPIKMCAMTWGGALALNGGADPRFDGKGQAPMMELRNQEFVGKTFRLDGLDAKGCKFVGCHFIYGGGTPPQLHSNHFVDDCTFGFDGAAANTLQLLGAFYQDGFRPLIEATIANIQAGNTQPVGGMR